MSKLTDTQAALAAARLDRARLHHALGQTSDLIERLEAEQEALEAAEALLGVRPEEPRRLGASQAAIAAVTASLRSGASGA